MPNMRIPASTALRVALKAYLASDHVSAATSKTLAVVISKNCAAFGNPSAGATNATELSNGWYYVDLSTTDTNTLGPLIVRATAATVDDVEAVFHVTNAHNQGFDGVADAVAGAAGGLPITTTVMGATLADGNHGGVNTVVTLKTPIASDIAKIAGQTATAAAPVAFPASIGTSTYAGADTSGTTEILTRLPDATAGTNGGLPTVNASNQIAGIASSVGKNTLDSLNDPSAADVADAVWDEAVSGHTTATNFGGKLQTAVSTPPTADAVADQVWDEAVSGHTTGTTFGGKLQTAVSTAPTVGQIDMQLSNTHGSGAWGAGAGASTKVYTVTVGGAPKAGAYCRLATRAAPLTYIDSGTSDSLGQVTFRHDLPAGTLVYVYVSLDGYQTLRDEEVI